PVEIHETPCPLRSLPSDVRRVSSGHPRGSRRPFDHPCQRAGDADDAEFPAVRGRLTYGRLRYIYVGAGLGTDRPALGELGRLVSENPLTFISVGIVGLAVAVAGTMLGFVLYQAADDFDRVARSDVADQDYITAGILKLKTYFQVSILLSVAAMLAGIAVGVS